MTWDYAFFEYYLSAALLVCAMLGMGTTLTLDSFRGVARSPRGVLVALGVQVLVTPLLAVALTRFFSLPVGVATGLLLVSALPGGLFSNVFCYLGRANVALSVSATALCTLCCLFTTTFVLRFFGGSQLPEGFSMPVGRIFFEIFVCLLLPLSAGMAVRRYLPDHFTWIGTWCIRASVVLLVLVILGSFTSGRIDLTAHGWRTHVAVILFGILSLLVTYAIGFACRLGLVDSYTVVIEVVARNAHLGVLLKAALFPAAVGTTDPVADAVLFVVLYSGGVALVITPCMVISRRIELAVMGDRHPAPPPDEFRALEKRGEESAD